MQEENLQSYRNKALLFIFCSFFIFSFRLEQISLYHTDEQYYIQSCRNMIESGDWLTPTLNEKKRFAKPILFYWFTSLSFKAFGVELSSARLVSVVLGTLCLWLTYLMGTTLFNPRTGYYSVFILASSYLYFLSTRLAYTDMAMVFFITLSLYFFCQVIVESERGPENKEKKPGLERKVFFFYIAIGLATATKGPPGFLLPFLTIGVFLLLTREREIPRLFFHPMGILLFLVLSLSWPFAMTWAHGSSFIGHLIHAEGVNRVFHTEKPSLYFFLVILRYFPPWSLFLVALAVFTFRTERGLLKTTGKGRLFLWLCIGAPLVLFTFLRTQHSRYMLPVAPAFAVLVGHYFHRRAGSETWPEDKGFRFCFYTTQAFYMVAGVLTLFACVFLCYLKWELFTYSFFLLPLAFAGAAILMRVFHKKGDFSQTAVIIAFPLLIFFPLFGGKILPSLNPDPMMEFAPIINGSRTPETRVGTYKFGNGNQRLRVLTGRPVEPLSKEEQLYNFLEGKKPVLLVVREADFKLFPEGVRLNSKIMSETKKWKKVKLTHDVLEQIKNEFAPGLQEKFREKVFLVLLA